MARSPQDHLQAALDAVALSRSADTRSELEADLGRALASLEQALALDPRLPTAQRERGRVLRWLGRHEESLDAFIDACSLAPADGELRLETAAAFAALDRPEAALTEYDAAIAVLPGVQPEALIGKARALTRLKRHAQALHAWEAVLALDDTRTVQLHGRPVRLLGEDARRVEAKVEHAWCLSQLGKDAFPAWQALLETHASALTGLSPPQAFLRALSELEVCRLAFERWLGQRGDDAPAWKRGVGLWMKAQRREEALATARRLVELAPADSRAWFELAEVHAWRGERTDAIAAYERSLALEPDFLGAKARLGAVRG